MSSCLIVGAGAGLGLALARRFGQGGLGLGLVARNREGLEALRADLEHSGHRAAA